MRRLFCLISAFLILFAFCGTAGFSGCSAARAEMDDISGGGPNGEASVRQLTMKDVQAMNPDSPVQAVFSNNGYLSVLMGKYYDQPVHNAEEGIESIRGLATLLGLEKGCEFFAVHGTKNSTGYTFYTYQQRYGQHTLRYATLRVIVGPDGYTAGLSCSFTPNAGTASREPTITADEALEIVRRRYIGQSITYYPEHTVREIAFFGNAVYDCYLIYTSNPDVTVSFDMPYLEHFVTIGGDYVYGIPASTFETEHGNAIDNSSYFEGFEMHEYSRTMRLEDGSIRTVTVPVGYNPRDGLYYLVDPERRIAVADYYDFNYADQVTFITSKSVGGWTQNNLLAYANYRIIYDFYADHGIRSADGFETPILITVNWVDENREPVDNAVFYGINRGWVCFGISNINHYGDSLDVVGHEYTHGVLRLTAQGILSINETGTINEALADIMGNLAEISLGYTDDREWKIGERSGHILRNMSDPNEMQQPEFVGDRYYKSPVLNPDSNMNDSGGIHRNNSLPGHIAWLMDQAGMSYEQQIGMWLTTMEILTPRSDYDDLHAALLLSLKISGILHEYGSALNRAFEATGLDSDWTESYLTAKREGFGRVTFDAADVLSDLACRVNFYDAGRDYAWVDNAYPDPEGRISTLLPEGEYVAQLLTVNDSGEKEYYDYTGTSWVTDGKREVFTVRSGEVTKLGYTGK